MTGHTDVSAISPDADLLFYRGQVPDDMAVNTSVAALVGQLCYLFKCGHTAVGRAVEAGAGVKAG